MEISEDQLKEMLTSHNVTTLVRFEDLKREAEENAVDLQSYLLTKKVVTDKELTKMYGEFLSVPYIDLTEVQVQRDTLKKLPEKVARKYAAVVFDVDEAGQYSLAMSDPEDIQAIQFIKKQFNKKPRIFIATQSDIDFVLDQYKEEFSQEISKAIQENREISLEEGELQESATAESVREIVQEAPIARAVNIILEYAVKSRASDVHIEPRETFIQIRYRVDGVLKDTMTLPKQILSSLITRIKILSNLRIDEHRIPQDGRIKVSAGGKNISIRVSTLPVMDGEKVVMRLLDESTKAASLEELGFRGLSLATVKNNLYRAHGMTLVTGPTGSGKSTTLYSLLTLLNDIGVNISTVEDPVEYRIPGINQTQVNPAVGMTFASGLRALLRQDPDIIMVGEIRDKETAEMGVHASLTGHVVLSTLHTNSAAGSLPRLEDMGVEPFLISSTVNAVIGQRLVRKLCEDCRASFEADSQVIAKIAGEFRVRTEFLRLESAEKEKAKATKLGLEKEDLEKITPQLGKKTITAILQESPDLLDKISPTTKKEIRYQLFRQENEPADTSATGLELSLFKQVGCPKCEKTGYKGRLGIYEVMEVTDEIGNLILQKGTEEEIIDEATKNGMLTMHQDGYVKAIHGITTIEEIIRVTKE